MQTIDIKLTEIKPYEKNAKKHPESQVKNVAESIKHFGWAQPIVVDENNVIIIGHGRLKAAYMLNLETAPCYVLKGLTEAEKNKLRLLDNKLNESEWDFDLLKEQLPELDFSDFPDLDWGIITPEEEKEVVEDEPPEVDEENEPTAKLGDIWQLGDHRLMCGDSTDAATVEKLMDGEKADMVFTDPPYGVAIGTKNRVLNSVQKSGRIIEDIENDTLNETELYDMLVKAMTNVRENCKPDASYYVTSPQGGSLGLMMMMMKDAGLLVRHVLMWKKNCATFSLGRLDYDYQHEPMFYTWTEKHHNYRKGKFRTTVWEIDKPRKCDLHPTMKPIELIAECLKDTTLPNDSVLDVFGGSGSTLIACEQLNRKCYMMELDPKYCDVIIKRWENLTGQKARKIN